MVLDFRRKRPEPDPVSIQGTEVELVPNYKYLGVQLDNKLDWSRHTEAAYKKGQSRLYFLRRLRSFNICQPLLCTFYKTVVASALFFGVVCWRVGARTSDRNRLNKLIKKASSTIGISQDWVVQVAEVRMLRKINNIMNNDIHPLHALEVFRQSSFRLIPPKTERHRKSFLPAAIKLYNIQ